ncbi:MAG: HAD family acid phosphatase, partial [Ignavibacterium sp.]|uniref:HAD family acid phosphatase n=1 Tax=Ignavibacterium sp. TaxID=2651167 RepID=UPI0040495FC6
MRSFLYLINLSFLLALTINFTLTSCRTSKDILNLSVAKDIVKDYYESGKYDQELTEIYSEAREQIEKIKITSNSLVIFDIDDTALSNYEISKRLDFGYDHQIVQDWVMSSKLPAIKQTLEFYNYLKSKGVKLIFLTGRQSEEYEATFRNLIETGYTDFDTLIVRNLDERDFSATKFKTLKREELTRGGYNIIMSVGDQWSDLEGEYTGIKVKIPNYLY